MRAALYARYSTDKQREASITDQHRDCARLAERHGFRVIAEFSDAAISGGTATRPGYQRMLEAARRGEFDVIVAEDTSRLWRNMAEQSPRIAELTDLGIAVVTHDLDTRIETAGMLGAVLGASSEAYRREIGRRTRRGLEGRARAKKATGGRAYGYDTVDGDLVIREDRAAIVREIFARFADGDSLRTIAADLNARGVPSAASTWNRKQRPADGRWRVSGLHSMLRNEIYIGRQIWNRSRWIRSAADSSKRRRVENPSSQWVVHERPELAIVDRQTWERVQRRHHEHAELFRPGPGGKPRYLLSGLLRCAACGGAYVIVAHNPVRYGCSTNRQAGESVCDNDRRVGRDVAEQRILEYVADRMLSAEAIEAAIRAVRQMARAEAEAQAQTSDLSRLESELAELERLRDSGAVSGEILAPALERAHRQLDRARRPKSSSNTIATVFGAEQAYREMLGSLRDAITGDDIPATREALRDMLGTIPLHRRGKTLVAELRPEEVLLVSGSETGMVAGACYWLELTPPNS